MTDRVEQQYTEWIYPQPTLDLRSRWQAMDPSFHQLHYAYWPNRPYRPGMRILVAGCGSMQAAQIADRNPTAQVLGIDISETSLAHERTLKKNFSLDNLTLERMAIDQIQTVGEKFDLIIATGVLHHQVDPAAALAILGRQLAQDGVISAMIYGKYFRTGVYMLQDLFRRTGLGQSTEDVAVARYVLANLHPYHPLRNYVAAAPDLQYDAGIVDTFLHTVDRAFTVAECLNLVAQADLRFQGWLENFYYYPNGQMNAAHPLFGRFEALPEPELWSAMELYSGVLGKHDFFCCRNDRPQATFVLDFRADAFFDLGPVLRDVQLRKSGPGSNDPAAMAVARRCEIGLNDVKLRFFQSIDGHRSVRRCIADCGISNDETGANFARNFLVSLWRIDAVVFRS